MSRCSYVRHWMQSSSESEALTLTCMSTYERNPRVSTGGLWPYRPVGLNRGALYSAGFGPSRVFCGSFETSFLVILDIDQLLSEALSKCD